MIYSVQTLASLPPSLAPNTLYFVSPDSAGVDIYISDDGLTSRLLIEERVNHSQILASGLTSVYVTQNYSDLKRISPAVANNVVLSLNLDTTSESVIYVYHLGLDKWYELTSVQVTLDALDTLNQVKSVDGSGSGLDADLVDGVHASDFATQSALDLKAPLASPTFTGNLVLPNNSRINNIEHFYQTTKPITRGDGSALVIGDRWWKTDEGTEWFWNGTYWLSPALLSPVVTANHTLSLNVANELGNYNLFIASVFWTGRVPSNNDVSNYRHLIYITYTNSGVNTFIASLKSTELMTPNSFFSVEVVENRFVSTSNIVENSSTPTMNIYYYQIANTGSPSNSWNSLQVKYHLSI